MGPNLGHLATSGPVALVATLSPVPASPVPARPILGDAFCHIAMADHADGRIRPLGATGKPIGTGTAWPLAPLDGPR
jgi:hypothetical protein